MRTILAILACSLLLSGCGNLLTEPVPHEEQIILVVPDSLMEPSGTWTTLQGS